MLIKAKSLIYLDRATSEKVAKNAIREFGKVDLTKLQLYDGKMLTIAEALAIMKLQCCPNDDVDVVEERWFRYLPILLQEIYTDER